VRHVAFISSCAHHAGIIQNPHPTLLPLGAGIAAPESPSRRAAWQGLICLDIFLLPHLGHTGSRAGIDPLGKEIEYHPAFRTGNS